MYALSQKEAQLACLTQISQSLNAIAAKVGAGGASGETDYVRAVAELKPAITAVEGRVAAIEERFRRLDS